MKIAIITINSRNYGNRLQNYALQNILMNLGNSVLTLRREENKKIKEMIKTIVQTVLQTKGIKFKQFDKNIYFSNEVVTKDDYPDNICSLYDYFIVGSDQVWNPYYDFVAGKCDFLEFAKSNQKVSYAASFGVSEIPDDRKKEYAEWLKSFKAISVREMAGAKIVKDLADREATVVLDPTLLLDENEWKHIEKKSEACPKNKYVFVYALGEKSDRFKKKIVQLSREFEIFDVCMVQKNGRELSVGPSEFLYLIRNAEMILTDSFHATVFSIIYHKKFVTFNRTGLNMNSRIASLAELIDARSQLNESGDWDCEIEIDYRKVDTILEEERRKSIDFLSKALKN